MSCLKLDGRDDVTIALLDRYAEKLCPLKVETPQFKRIDGQSIEVLNFYIHYQISQSSCFVSTHIQNSGDQTQRRRNTNNQPRLVYRAEDFRLW